MKAMIQHRNLRKLSVGLAIFAVLLASLAPSVSRIVFGQGLPDLTLVETCTAEGLQLFPASLLGDTEPQTPERPYSGDHFEHCPFCLTNAASFGLMPVEAGLLASIAAEGDHFPPHALSALHARPIRQPNQARAPPVFL